jgi:hypothetical protein
MHVKMRRQVPQKQIVQMTRREDSTDCATDMLNIPPVVGEFLRCQITEVGDMPTPEDHCDVSRRNRLPFK